jgi:PHD-finger
MPFFFAVVMSCLRSFLLDNDSADKQKSGPGRKSNAEHAIAFYEYVLETITESQEGEDNGKEEATKADAKVGAQDDSNVTETEATSESPPGKRRRGRPPKNKNTDANPPNTKQQVVVDTASTDEVEAEKSNDTNDDQSLSVESMDTQEFINQHNDLCEVCSKGGELLMCSTCNLVFHLECVRPKMEAEPDDSWVCAYCIMSGVKGHKQNSKLRKSAAVAVRLMARTRKALQRKRARTQQEQADSSSSSDSDDDDDDSVSGKTNADDQDETKSQAEAKESTKENRRAAKESSATTMEARRTAKESKETKEANQVAVEDDSEPDDDKATIETKISTAEESKEDDEDAKPRAVAAVKVKAVTEEVKEDDDEDEDEEEAMGEGEEAANVEEVKDGNDDEEGDEGEDEEGIDKWIEEKDMKSEHKRDDNRSSGKLALKAIQSTEASTAEEEEDDDLSPEDEEQHITDDKMDEDDDDEGDKEDSKMDCDTFKGDKKETAGNGREGTAETTATEDENDEQSIKGKDTYPDANKSDRLKGAVSKDSESCSADKTPPRRNASNPTTAESVKSEETDGSGGRYIRRNRTKAVYYDPQNGPARKWQSDGAREWKHLGTPGSDDEVDDDVNEDGGETKEKKDDNAEEGNKDDAGNEVENPAGNSFGPISPKKAGIPGAPWCNFCNDDKSIPVCVFCACRVCFGKHDTVRFL